MALPKILVVDDSRVVRVQLRRTLTSAGYEVELAEDGHQAVRCIRDVAPQLVILDIQMPRLDGYGTCQELKEMGAPYDNLPIIFLTSLKSHALDLLGCEMGAYLKKPVSDQLLIETVHRFLKPQDAVQSSP